MKKEILTHILAALFFTLVTIVLKGLFNLSYWPFIPGIILGTILPDIDHLIYVLYLAPQELTSQRVIYGLKRAEFLKTWEILAVTRNERKHLILHTVVFQIVFLVLSFLIITSSGSIFGRGLVTAFLLHLVVDETIDLSTIGNLANWFYNLPFTVPAMPYYYLNVALLFIFSILL